MGDKNGKRKYGMEPERLYAWEPVTAQSSRQELFVRRQKREQLLILLARALLLILFVLAWEYAGRKELIDSFIFSSPSEIVECFLRMLKDHTILHHIAVTLKETILSFLLSIGIGVLAAVCLWACRRLAQILEPFLVVLNSLPKSALAPLLIVWLGANTRTIIVVGVSLAVFGTILNLYTGFLDADKEQVKLIYTLGGGRMAAMTKVIIPGTLPMLVSVMKVNIGLSLVGVVIGEFLAANEGLGYLIIYGSQVFQLNLVMMSIFILCVIAFALYQGVALLEKKLQKNWQKE